MHVVRAIAAAFGYFLRHFRIDSSFLVRSSRDDDRRITQMPGFGKVPRVRLSSRFSHIFIYDSHVSGCCPANSYLICAALLVSAVVNRVSDATMCRRRALGLPPDSHRRAAVPCENLVFCLCFALSTRFQLPFLTPRSDCCDFFRDCFFVFDALVASGRARAFVSSSDSVPL